MRKIIYSGALIFTIFLALMMIPKVNVKATGPYSFYLATASTHQDSIDNLDGTDDNLYNGRPIGTFGDYFELRYDSTSNSIKLYCTYGDEAGVFNTTDYKLYTYDIYNSDIVEITNFTFHVTQTSDYSADDQDAKDLTISVGSVNYVYMTVSDTTAFDSSLSLSMDVPLSYLSDGSIPISTIMSSNNLPSTWISSTTQMFHICKADTSKDTLEEVVEYCWTGYDYSKDLSILMALEYLHNTSYVSSCGTTNYTFPAESSDIISAFGTKVTSTLINLTESNTSLKTDGNTYSTTLTAASGYTVPLEEDITVTNGTISSYNHSTGKLEIGNITGDLEITASAFLVADIVENKTIKYDGTTKISSYVSTNTKYRVTYDNDNVNKGVYTATLSLKDGYIWSDFTKGNKTVIYTIEKKILTESDLTISSPSALSLMYTGSDIEPVYTIEFDGNALVEGTDFTVTYSGSRKNPDDIGIANIVFSMDNYEYEANKTYTITKKGIENLTIECNLEYQGKEITELLSGTNYSLYNSIPYTSIKTLVSDSEYIVEVTEPGTNAGDTVKYKITANDNSLYYTGSYTFSSVIGKKDIANNVEIAKDSVYPYTGSEIKPDFIITYLGTTLVLNTDYTISYASNISIGEANITLTGIGDNYTGNLYSIFAIGKRDISSEIIITVNDDCIYDGSLVEPSISVYFNNTTVDTSDDITLNLNTDYSAVFSNNTLASNKALITIAILNSSQNFTGSTTKEFTISPKEIEESMVNISSLKVVSLLNDLMPSAISVIDSTYTLKEKEDYKLSLVDNNNQTMTLSIIGNGNYTGVIDKIISNVNAKTYPSINTSFDEIDEDALAGLNELKDLVKELSLESIDELNSYATSEGYEKIEDLIDDRINKAEFEKSKTEILFYLNDVESNLSTSNKINVITDNVSSGTTETEEIDAGSNLLILEYIKNKKDSLSNIHYEKCTNSSERLTYKDEQISKLSLIKTSLSSEINYIKIVSQSKNQISDYLNSVAKDGSLTDDEIECLKKTINKELLLIENADKTQELAIYRNSLDDIISRAKANIDATKYLIDYKNKLSSHKKYNEEEMSEIASIIDNAIDNIEDIEDESAYQESIKTIKKETTKKLNIVKASNGDTNNWFFLFSIPIILIIILIIVRSKKSKDDNKDKKEDDLIERRN